MECFRETDQQLKIVVDFTKQLQADLDEWLIYYNTERTHQGKMCYGRTPFETMLDGAKIWQEKKID